MARYTTDSFDEESSGDDRADVPAELRELIQKGQLIQAIKWARAEYGESYQPYYRENSKSIRRMIDGNLATARATASKTAAALDAGQDYPTGSSSSQSGPACCCQFTIICDPRNPPS